MGGGGRSRDPQAARGSLEPEQSTVSRARNSRGSSRLSLSFSEEMLLLELEHRGWMMIPLRYSDLLPGALLPSWPTERLLELAMLPEQRELSLLTCSGVEKLLE